MMENNAINIARSHLCDPLFFWVQRSRPFNCFLGLLERIFVVENNVSYASHKQAVDGSQSRWIYQAYTMNENRKVMDGTQFANGEYIK